MKFYSLQKRWFIGKDIVREYLDFKKIISIQKILLFLKKL